MTCAFTTGIPNLDDMLGGGLHPGTVTLVCGASQSGMTTLLDTVVRVNAHDRGVPVLLADLETQVAERAKRFFAALSNVPLNDIQGGRLDPDDFAKVTAAVLATANAPLWFSEATTVGALRRDIAAAETRPKLIAVDGMRYLNPASDPLGDAETLAGLRAVASDWDAAVIATHPTVRCDLSRPPLLADLPAEMTAVADAVVTLHRADAHSQAWRMDEVAVSCVKSCRGRCGSTTVMGIFEVARMVPISWQAAA